MDRKYEINDRRQKKDFSRMSFSGYKRTEVELLLRKSLLETKIEQAQYWCAELICVAEFDKLWEIFYIFACKYIHIANPRILPYLEIKYNQYESIKSTGYHDYEISMRNNQKIRDCFAEIICVFCYSSKMPVLTPLKIHNKELSILNLQGRLNAKDMTYGKIFIKKDDPEELLIPINELAYLCFEKDAEYNTKIHDVLFWLHWILSYDEHCRKNKISLECATRQTNCMKLTLEQKKDVIWIIWDIIYEANLTIHDGKDVDEKYRQYIHRVLESLMCFYKIKFTNKCKKRKISMLYFAFQLLFMKIDTSLRLITKNEKENTELIKSNINIIYEAIKQNEILTNTEYLFNNINDSQQNRENTQKRLEIMKDIDSMNL
jgi:hypothetical protein